MNYSDKSPLIKLRSKRNIAAIHIACRFGTERFIALTKILKQIIIQNSIHFGMALGHWLCRVAAYCNGKAKRRFRFGFAIAKVVNAFA